MKKPASHVAVIGLGVSPKKQQRQGKRVMSKTHPSSTAYSGLSGCRGKRVRLAAGDLNRRHLKRVAVRNSSVGSMMRKPASQNPIIGLGLSPKSNQHRQGPRGSSTPNPWSTSYSGIGVGSDKRVRKVRHFRHLAGESLADLLAMTEDEAERTCLKYKLVRRLKFLNPT